MADKKESEVKEIEVKAIERCYFGQIREEGEKFYVPADTDFKDAPFERVEPDDKPTI